MRMSLDCNERTQIFALSNSETITFLLQHFDNKLAMALTLWTTDKPQRSGSSIIPPISFRLAQLVGMYPYRYPWTSAYTKPPVNRFLACYSAGLIATLVFGFLAWSGSLATVYKYQLAKLEFFVIVSFIFKIVIFLQGVVLLSFGVFRSRYLPALVAGMETSLGTAVPNDVRLCRYTFRALLVTWNFLYIALCLVSFLQAYRTVYPVFTTVVDGFLRNLNLYGGPPAAPYVFIVVKSIMIGIVLVYETFPVLFVLTLLREIKRGFSNINKELHHILGDPENPDTAQTIVIIREQYRRLQCHVVDVDKAFAPLVIVGYIREFVGFIAILGALLQFKLTNDEEVKDDVNTAQIDDSTRYMVFGFGTMGLFNMALKMYVAVTTHTEAQDVWVNLRKILARCRHPTVQTECAVFISECDKSDGAISAGGVFFITKESIADLMEMMITYGILIYQARDTKQDIADLPTKEEFNRFREEMRQLAFACPSKISSVFIAKNFAVNGTSLPLIA